MADTATLPLLAPIEPMLARLSRELPLGDYLYEPKWDGFRAIAFRDGDEVDIRSRHGRPMSRYFPEVAAALGSLRSQAFVVDGEIVVARGARSFGDLMLRLHPAASRVERLSRETPAAFIAFDLLADADGDLRATPFAERRERLVRLLANASGDVRLSPITDDPLVAGRWLDGNISGIDGVVAKARTLGYEPGRRVMVKVKRERTVDCVVGGFRVMSGTPRIGSLLLGLYEAGGKLRHVGVASNFTEAARRAMLADLHPLITVLEGHPWERGFGLGRGPMGRLAGAAGRWDPSEMSMDWVPVRPERVVEVAYDALDAGRFRHPARFRRWRPDRASTSCTFDQLEPATRAHSDGPPTLEAV